MIYSHKQKKMNNPTMFNYKFTCYKQMDVYFWSVAFSFDEEGYDQRYAQGTCPSKAACFDLAAEYREYCIREEQ